jgi:hypothetical protein
MSPEKGLAETAIEIRILGEPHRGSRLPPELDHVVGGHGRCLGIAGPEISASIKFLFNESFAACGRRAGSGLVQR